MSQSNGGRGPSRTPGQQDTPFGSGLSLGRWAGIPVRAHWSVLIVAALFAVVIATVDLPASRPGYSPAAYWVFGVLTAIVFFLTLLAHEVAHAVVARHYGVGVRRITLWMLGGLTELAGESPSPRADALVAGVGPLVSLGLAGLFAAAAWAVDGAGLLVTALQWLALTNVVLGVFNLLPGAPLDGGRLLRALLWWRHHDRARAADQAARAGRVLGMLLIGLGLLGLLAGTYAGVWTALIGWFILSGAASERYAVRAEKLHGLRVRAAMTPTPRVAPDWWTVEQLMTTLTPEASRQTVFPLVDVDGRFEGVVTPATLEHVPRDRRAATRLGGLTLRTGQLLVADPDDDLGELLLPLHLRGGVAVVVEHGHPVGVVTEADLARVAVLTRTGWAGGPPSGSAG